MPFKPGQKRPPSAGRKKGTPNSKTLELSELISKFGCQPGEVLARVARGERIMALAYANKETGEFVEHEVMPTLDQMIQADKELTQYVYPKRKAVEHSGEIGLHEATLDALK